MLRGVAQGTRVRSTRALGCSLLFAAALVSVVPGASGLVTVGSHETLQARPPHNDPRHHTAQHPAALPAAYQSSGARPAPHISASDEETLVWQSPEQCERVVRDGGRMAMRTPDVLRVGTWNIRWFPRGRSPDRRNHLTAPTDLAWLTCALVWMQPDILVVQESLTTDKAGDSWTLVRQALERRTGETWQWSVQRCGKPDRHHVGVLWNTHRATLSGIRSLWPLNARAGGAQSPCKGGRHPGHYAHVRSPRPSGVDFHLIGLHLKSGATVAAVEERQRALNRIDGAVAPLLDTDRDVIILGDLNTMGAGDTHSQRAELKYVRRMVAKETPGFDDLRLKPQCSHYFRGRGNWLDHVLVAQDMAEVNVRSARVTGYCAVTECRRIRGEYPLAYQRLSDHCPVIFAIQNHDRDPHP